MPKSLRHEYKYYITPGEAKALSTVLDHILWRDPNASKAGTYHIRSLYFDDAYNSAYFDKVAGVETRNKYRIRIYNMSDKIIRLERKSKHGSYIEKTSAKLSRDDAERLIIGDVEMFEKADDPLLLEIFRLVKTRGLKPAVIVDYTRKALIHPAENTRVTFDSDIRSGHLNFDIFNRNIPTIPALSEHETVLEVKFDRVIPDMLPPLLSSAQASRSAVSKYVLCRQLEL